MLRLLLATLLLLGPATASGQDLPQDYVLPALGGGQVDVSAMKGQPLLVNLWASWCPPCLKELPQLKALHETWAPRGLRMVGLAIDDQPGKVALRVKEQAIPWPIAFEASGPASRTFATGELPTSILYDAEGKRVWSHQGEVTATDPDLVAALQKLLPGG